MIRQIIVRQTKAPLQEKLELRLQESELTIKPIKTALTQVENEITARSHGIADLQNKLTDLQERALKKEQTKIATLLSKFADSNATRPTLVCESAEDDEVLNHIGSELSQKLSEIRQLDQSLIKVHGGFSALGQRLAEFKTRVEINQTTSERTRAESVNLQREINNLQMNLNDVKTQKDSSAVEQSDVEKGLEIEQSISKLKENLNSKISDSKTANNQHNMLSSDMTTIEEQVHSLDTSVLSLQKELLEGSRQYYNSIFSIRKTLTEKNALLSDGGTTEKQLAALKKTHNKMQHENTHALKKADQRIADLTRELALGEIKIQTTRDKAATTARSNNANLKRQISKLKKQLHSRHSELQDNDLKFSDQNEASQANAILQRESVELKAKLRALNKLLAETMAEKKALQKQINRKVDIDKPIPTISDTIGITDSMPTRKATNSADNKKQKKTS